MKERKTVWNGVDSSIRAAAKALKVTYDTLQYRLCKGYTCDDDVPIPSLKDK